MELASRRIVHLNVSESPSLDWVKQQIREAAPVGQQPKYLMHDNDGIFGQFGGRRRVEGRDGISEKAYRCHLDWWLETVMGIKGIAIPYGAPNASPRLERFHRAPRYEALNHFIFFNEDPTFMRHEAEQRTYARAPRPSHLTSPKGADARVTANSPGSSTSPPAPPSS